MKRIRYSVMGLALAMSFGLCSQAVLADEAKEPAAEQAAAAGDYVDEDGHVYKNMTEEELLQYVHEIAGEEGFYRWEEDYVYIQVEVTYNSLYNDKQLDCAYHIGTNPFELEEDAVMNVDADPFYVWLDPLICTPQIGVTMDAEVTQEKLDEMVASVKEAEDGCRILVRGAIREIRKSGSGKRDGFGYKCKLITSDYEIVE